MFDDLSNNIQNNELKTKLEDLFIQFPQPMLLNR